MSHLPPIRRSTSIFDLPTKELVKFLSWAFGFAFVAYVALSAIGFAPASIDLFSPFRQPTLRAEDELPRRSVPVVRVEEKPETPRTYSIPTKVLIPSVGIEAEIYQPKSVDIPTLDALLAKGAVYYPGSGVIEEGNVFIFGHSTNWPVVRNQAYKTFNDLDKLEKGDKIYLFSGGKKYEYRVTSVGVAPDSDVLVKFNQDSRRLTLSTCNTFGLKEERIVVEADFKGEA